MTQPHEDAVNDLTSEMYIAEITALHEQVAYYRQACEEQDATIRTRDTRIAELEDALRKLYNTYSAEILGLWWHQAKCRAWREAGRVLAL